MPRSAAARSAARSAASFCAPTRLATAAQALSDTALPRPKTRCFSSCVAGHVLALEPERAQQLPVRLEVCRRRLHRLFVGGDRSGDRRARGAAALRAFGAALPGGVAAGDRGRGVGGGGGQDARASAQQCGEQAAGAPCPAQTWRARLARASSGSRGPGGGAARPATGSVRPGEAAAIIRSMPSGTHVRLPLLLTDDVHFPCTRVRLPLAGALLCDLLLRPPEERWLGVVLARQPGVAPAGTASRLVELEPDGEGARALLLGAHRFAVAEAPPEIGGGAAAGLLPHGARAPAARAAARRARAAAAGAARGARRPARGGAAHARRGAAARPRNAAPAASTRRSRSWSTAPPPRSTCRRCARSSC